MYAPDESVGFGPEMVDPRDAAWQGLRSGTHYLTRLQKQQVATNAAKRSWLQTADIPDDVRQRELASVDDVDGRIVPMPRSPDEMPRAPDEQISGQVFVDREGKFGHPGATLVLNPKSGQWDWSRNAPNNNMDYISREEPSLPSVGAGGAGPALGAAIGEMATGQYPPRSGRRLLPSVQDQNRMYQGQQKLQFAEQQQQLRQEQQQQKLEAAKAKAAADQAKFDQNLYHGMVDRELKRQAAAHKIANEDAAEPATFTPNYDEANRNALGQYYRTRNLSKDLETREKYAQWLEGQYDGLSDAELQKRKLLYLDGPEAKQIDAELARRASPDGPPPSAPRGWQQNGPPVPAGLRDTLRKLSPEQLAAFRRRALTERPYTKEEYAKAFSGSNYAQYLRARTWAAESPDLRIEDNGPTQEMLGRKLGDEVAQYGRDNALLDENPEPSVDTESEPAPQEQAASPEMPILWPIGVPRPGRVRPTPPDTPVTKFTHMSASGKFGWDGTQWVPTGK